MDLSVIQEFFINSGVAGGVLLAVMFGFLVPKWYVKKLEQENKILKDDNNLKTEMNKELITAAATANQLIGELRTLAQKRHESA